MAEYTLKDKCDHIIRVIQDDDVPFNPLTTTLTTRDFSKDSALRLQTRSRMKHHDQIMSTYARLVHAYYFPGTSLQGYVVKQVYKTPQTLDYRRDNLILKPSERATSSTRSKAVELPSAPNPVAVEQDEPIALIETLEIVGDNLVSAIDRLTEATDRLTEAWKS